MRRPKGAPPEVRQDPKAFVWLPGDEDHPGAYMRIDTTYDYQASGLPEGRKRKP